MDHPTSSGNGIAKEPSAMSKYSPDSATLDGPTPTSADSSATVRREKSALQKSLDLPPSQDSLQPLPQAPAPRGLSGLTAGPEETAIVELTRYMDEALGGIRPPRARSRAKAPSPAPYCLPPGCQGGGYQIRARMQAIASQCQTDLSCYRARLEQLWHDMQEGKMPWAAQSG